MHSKIESINEIIRENVSLRLRELEQDTFFSISRVETSRDLSFTDITITTLENEQSFIKRVNGYVFDIKKYLAKHAKLRRVPNIRFHLDKGKDYAIKIDNLLDQINK